MDTAAKCQMSIGRTPDIQLIGRGELPGIAICRSDTKSDLSSCRHVHTAELHRLHRNAIAELVRTFVAQELFDGAFDQV